MEKKVNIGLSQEAHTKAKIICVLKGITLSEYISKALEKELEHDKQILAKLKEK